MSVQTTFSQDLTAGFAGQKVGNGSFDVEPMRNGEASAEMAFGIAVKHDSTTDERDAELFTAVTGEALAGIIIHSHSYDVDNQLGDDGVLPTYEIQVARRGRLLVPCEDGCDVGDPLFIRAVATGAELQGALLASADASDCIDMTGYATWRTSAAAGALAELEFDFTGFATP
jgi:hypothetical protein